MVSATDIAREQEAGLALLFQRGLELALRIQEDAMAVETAEERARLGAAFHRIARGVRQTAALRVRLAHEALRGEREDHAEVVRLDERRAAKRKAQVKATVERLIWTEAESEDAAEGLVEDLETLLGEDELYGRLAEGEVEAHVARLREELGLPADPPADPPIEAAAGEAPARGPSTFIPDHPFRSSA